MSTYRGRIAPTPTGWLHLGHARTFVQAWRRARAAGGQIILRNEDLDAQRCRPEYTQAMVEDLRWLELDWDEGPEKGGPFSPYTQSDCREYYLAAWRVLRDRGSVYPCLRSRRELREIATAPHENEEGAEPIYPPEWRPPAGTGQQAESPTGANWRFRVPDGETITFHDTRKGKVSFTAGEDFGDFAIWRRDNVPAYELAVVVDDARQRITEVVRGEDLLKSTARQLLLYREFGYTPPTFHHTPLVRDASGRRLAKRHQSLSLRELRTRGYSPNALLSSELPHPELLEE